ncbi:diacylglyceryl transferase [Frateuria sp. Soil773]|uniref:prolipoprotein diacylglyceryl transferase n=1 Tax=Frateuria sp. Soil773 TaxID=1736407 RepID=UPI0006F1EBA4|nr:prolipoprotein diacylglyceryl transferase family protein [Frateuria sp. Soil773]KRE89144.1 diacylglyceryl transferase [Frateuria sp. Soil773]
MAPVALHTVFEMLAYAVGFRLFLWTRRTLAPAAFGHEDHVVWTGVGAIAGAALGAKLAFWIDDPLAAFADFPDLRHLLEGKSIVGALLGGLVGVELAKKIAGIRSSTGDAFVLPLTVGMCIGRVGCYLAGLGDHTYGTPTALPWGVDFGDGLRRHPTQLYEIAFLLLQYAVLHARRHAFARPGDRFRAFMAGYLLFRLLVEFIKPSFYLYPGGLSGLQWLCVAGLAYYAPAIPRILRALFARGSGAWEPR